MHRTLFSRLTRMVVGILMVVVVLGGIFISTQGQTKAAHAAAPQTTSPTDYPVIFIHGFSLDGKTNCTSQWQKDVKYLQSTSSKHPVHFTGSMNELGFYSNDTQCNNNLSTSGSPWRNNCVGFDGTQEQDVGTNQESIRHLACELAWYIYDNYSQYDTNVQIVAYSMGGLIARYALYGVQQQISPFPPTLFASDIVDFDTPNGGAIFGPLGSEKTAPSIPNCFSIKHPLCLQAQQMVPGSDFINELTTYGQNPQGTGQGTNWTLLGSSYGINCDLVVHPESAVYMDGGQKFVYTSPCYPHTGYHSMPFDNSSTLNATVSYCNNCSKEEANNWTNWPTSSTYPHSINEMYSSFFHTLTSQAIVSVPDGTGQDACQANTLPANDDNSSNAVSLPFTANFFGITYNSVFISNNGYVTFDAPLSDYTPFPLDSTTHAIIAPFFADVDTRPPSSGPVTYGIGTYQGYPTLCVNWVNVGYYSEHTDKLNSFQLLLVDRSDRNPGDFDMVMNYDQIQWETGDASGGTDGFGGYAARVGYSNGSTTFYELPGSGASGALLDVSGNGLIAGSWNSNQLGSYDYQVENTGSAVRGKVSTAQPKHLAKPKK